MVSVNRIAAWRCTAVTAARACAMRAPRLLVQAPPPTRAASSSPTLPVPLCMWGSSVTREALGAGGGALARAAGRGPRAAACGQFSNSRGMPRARIVNVRAPLIRLGSFS